MTDVQKAAEFLDSNVDKFAWLTADWRTKIDTDKLNMYSSTDCILGQIAGNYDTAYCNLKLEAMDSDIRGAFNGCVDADAWIKYLKESTNVYINGTNLRGKYNKTKYTVQASYKNDGVRYYVLTMEGVVDGGGIHTESTLKRDWTDIEPKKYKKGDILALRGLYAGTYVLVCDHDHGARIGGTHGGLYSGKFSNAPMSEYIRHEYDIVGNINNVAGVKF